MTDKEIEKKLKEYTDKHQTIYISQVDNRLMITGIFTKEELLEVMKIVGWI